MDYMYSAVTPPKAKQIGQQIVVVSKVLRGSGDLMFGAKVSRLLKNELPDVNVEFIWNSAGNEGLAKEIGLMGEYFNNADPKKVELKEGEPTAKSLAGKIVVSGPIIPTSDQLDAFREDQSIDVTFASEYGVRDEIPWMDPEHFNWREAPSGAGPYEYGLVLEPPSNFHLAVNKELAKHVIKGEYHFAYVNGKEGSKGSHREVLEILFKYYKSNPKSCLPVVFADSKINRERLFDNLKPFSDEFKVGYDFVDLSDRKEDRYYQPEGDKRDKGNLLKILFQRMTRNEFLAALGNSHPMRFVTGDQSLSEALSLTDSIVVYEALWHKKKAFEDLQKWCDGLVYKLGEAKAEDIRNHSTDDYRDCLDRIHRELDYRYRIVGAVKGAILRREDDDIRKLDKTISEFAQKRAPANDLWPHFVKLADFLAKFPSGRRPVGRRR